MGLLSLIYLLFHGGGLTRQPTDRTTGGMTHANIAEDFFVADSLQPELLRARSRRSQKNQRP